MNIFFYVLLLQPWFSWAGNLASSQVVLQANLKQPPRGWESYDSRPDILTIPAKSHTFDSEWEGLKKGHFSFVAQILAFYDPQTQIYFLARDSEYIFDVARLVTEGTPDFDRIHILNISQDNVFDKHMAKYLAQNGIIESELLAGKKVLFVDTGFAGSIPATIEEMFSEPARKNINTQLVVSFEKNIPSSRSFLIHTEPEANHSHMFHMKPAMDRYEHMPRYTDRSTKFQLIQGSYHAVSKKGTSRDGVVSKEMSYHYMQDLKYFWSLNTTQQRFIFERERFNWLKSVAQSSEAERLIKVELSKVQGDMEREIFEAHIKDFIEHQKIHYQRRLNFNKIRPRKKFQSRRSLNKANNLIRIEGFGSFQVAQEVSASLPSPWDKLSDLLDTRDLTEVEKGKIQDLFGPQSSLAQDQRRQAQYLNQASNDVLLYLARYIFDKPHTQSWSSLVRILVERGSSDVLVELARSWFSKMKVETRETWTLREALFIYEPDLRIQFIETHLGPGFTQSSYTHSNFSANSCKDIFN